MTLEEMTELVVDEHAKDDSMMLMWVTGPVLTSFEKLMNAWGFTYGGTWLLWIKLNKHFSNNFNHLFKEEFKSLNIKNCLNKNGLIDADDMLNIINKIEIPNEKIIDTMTRSVKMGQGYHTRANAEYLIYGKRGKGIGTPEVRNVKEVIFVPYNGVHSYKPDIVYDIDKLYPHATSKLEMFARRKRKGWKVWGNDPNIQSDVKIKKQNKISSYF